MGAWGYEAWENDGAADWFGDLFSETGLAGKVERTLQLDVKEHHEEIRAAALLVRKLAQTYIWPVDLIDKHRTLATKQLQAMLDAGAFAEGDPFASAIQKEIKELRSLEKPKAKEPPQE